jgi:hypothetical protein
MYLDPVKLQLVSECTLLSVKLEYTEAYVTIGLLVHWAIVIVDRLMEKNSIRT